MSSQMLASTGHPDNARRDPVGTEVDRLTRQWRAVVEAAASTLDESDTNAVGAEVLRERVRLFERLRGVAAVGMADTVRALQACGAITNDGASSTTEWLKATTGRSGRDAARAARLATDLADLPATRTALAAGELTDEAADVDAELAPVARASSPEDLRATVRARQQAADADATLHDERRQHARRSFRLVRQDTGTWRPSGELPDELGQAFRTALDAFDHPDGDVPAAQRRRPDQRLCDALEGLVGAVLDGGLAPGTGGIARPHLSVLVDATTVSADLTDPDTDDVDDGAAAPAPDDPRWADLPGGQLPWGGQLSPQAVRRICCDANVSRIVMSGPSQVLDVGRATREWSGPQRRAVNARDRGCRGPNCTRPVAWTAVHHLRWWHRDRGPTDIDNGLALCHHCHRLVHDHGWTVHLDPTTATATWTSPTGTTHITRPAGNPTAAPPSHPPAGPAATPATPTTATPPPARQPGLVATTSGGPPRP